MARTRFYLRGKPMNALRLLVVIVNLVPYHVARWTAVAEAGHQVTVLQRRAGDPFAVLATDAAQAPFQLHTLADPLVGGVSWQRQLVAWIDRLNPQVLVISGYSFPESLAALLVAADTPYPEWILVGGLGVFGIAFAINSSIHSYLVLAYAGSEKAAEDVGFYYAANAAGRFIGTLLSGVLYQWGGLGLSLAGSATMLAVCWGVTLVLPQAATVERETDSGR